MYIDLDGRVPDFCKNCGRHKNLHRKGDGACLRVVDTEPFKYSETSRFEPQREGEVYFIPLTPEEAKAAMLEGEKLVDGRYRPDCWSYRWDSDSQEFECFDLYYSDTGKIVKELPPLFRLVHRVKE
jgi:hypothetical protein